MNAMYRMHKKMKNLLTSEKFNKVMCVGLYWPHQQSKGEEAKEEEEEEVKR